MGHKGIEFDARRFEYIGSPVRNHDTCVLTKGSGITSVERWMAAKTPVKLGRRGAERDHRRRPQDLEGSPGSPHSARFGLQRDLGDPSCRRGGGGCRGLRPIVGVRQIDLGECPGNRRRRGRVAEHPETPPRASQRSSGHDLAKSEEGRQFIEIGIHDASAITYLYSLAPGTPKDRVQSLRRAFLETMKDSEFVAETKKAKMDLAPLSGEEVEQTVGRFFKLNPAMVAKLKEILE